MFKKHKKEFGYLEVIFLVLFTSLVSIAMIIFINGDRILIDDKKKPDNNEVIALTDEMKRFVDNYNYFIENYYGDINEKELLEAAFEAVTEASGDEHAEYFDENAAENFDIAINGYFSGLGIEIIASDDNYIKLVRVFEDSPASKVKLQANDIIVEINGTDLKDKTTTEFRDLVKSINGDITLKYKRDNKIASVTLKKGIVNLKSVYASMLDEKKKIGYLKVDIFASNTGDQFIKALKDLEDNGMKSLILDLRGNNGGHLNVVTKMVSQFLNKDKVIYQVVSKTNTEKVYSSGNKTKGYPIVVLVDGVSASASELMAAALKEQYGAILVGMKTYGKSTIQEVKNYTVDIEYKLTIKEWLTPNGVRLNKVGIVPDYEINLAEEYLKNPIVENDNQLAKALELLKK